MAGKENMGPVPKGPGARGRGPRPKIENPGKLFKRIMKYVFKYYWFQVHLQVHRVQCLLSHL